MKKTLRSRKLIPKQETRDKALLLFNSQRRIVNRARVEPVEFDIARLEDFRRIVEKTRRKKGKKRTWRT